MDTTTSLTMDAIEQSLADGEATIARVRRSQMVLIREADRRQAPTADGCRSMAEWVTGRLDVAPETAKMLVSTARRLESLPTVDDTVGGGLISFDRTVAVARIADPSQDATIVDELAVFDVAGIRRLVSNRHRMTRDTEREAFETRYVVAQPNLDESSWRVHGQLPGVAGRCFVDALDAKADQLPPDPDGNQTRTTRWADALWAISLDSLAGSDGATVESATPLLTVFVDATDAAPTGGETVSPSKPDPESDPMRSKRSCVTGSSRSPGEAKTAHRWAWDAAPGPSHPASADSSWPATVRCARSRAVSADTASSHTTSPHGAKADQPTPRTSPHCAGSTTTSSSTAEASPSTPTRHPTADNSTDHPSTHPPGRLDARSMS
jgi:hypothetical protein